MRPSLKLTNYLRTHRKRTSLSQEDVTFLLGAKSGAKVSRYERFGRRPGLDIAFAYEVIFQTPARELFGGLYAEAQRDVLARANLLLQKVSREKSGPRTDRKLDALKAITELVAPESSETI